MEGKRCLCFETFARSELDGQMCAPDVQGSFVVGVVRPDFACPSKPLAAETGPGNLVHSDLQRVGSSTWGWSLVIGAALRAR